jgi:hypothetical protein
MTQYNVVRNSRDEAGGQDPLPEILDAVLDGEVDVADPRVCAALRCDKDATRRFRETQRVTDRLARRISTPDLSASILAVVHAKQPFAKPQRRRPVSAHRIAFAGGLLAGVALVIILQTVAKGPKSFPVSDLAAANPTTTDLLQGTPLESPASRHPRRSASEPLRQPLAIRNASKYEATTAPRASAHNFGIQVAGFSGNVDLNQTTLTPAVLVAAAANLCDSLDQDIAGAIPHQPFSTPTTTMAVAYVPTQEWPPADISAFVEHVSICGVTEDFGAPITSR